MDPSQFEFHASECRAGKKAPYKSIHKAERYEIIRSVLKIFADSRATARAFACVVHRPDYPNSDPVELAFEDICSRFDMMLKRIYHQEANPQRGLLVIDRSSRETTLRNLANEFKTLGTRWRVVHNICEVPLFVNSRAARTMQLADHIAWATYRRYEVGDTSFMDIFAHRFDSEGPRVHGLCHKHTSLATCRCVACASRLQP